MTLQLRLYYANFYCQLSDTAEGLCYLHSCNVIHGDLKGVRGPQFCLSTLSTPNQNNILVDDSGHARIVDFGLAMVTKNSDSILSATINSGHTPRWTAPEVLKDGNHSKEADIFSFAMVMIEVRHEWFPVYQSLINYRFQLI